MKSGWMLVKCMSISQATPKIWLGHIAGMVSEYFLVEFGDYIDWKH